MFFIFNVHLVEVIVSILANRKIYIPFERALYIECLSVAFKMLP